jgi:sulfur-carrier protein adenylyltransferase/sulfurtransferase
MLSPAQKQRYARHLLLAEVGEAGQERLCRASIQLPGDADPRAAAVAREYLERAGVSLHGAAPVAPAVAGAPHLQLNGDALYMLAGDPRLEPAAAALLGALYAVEAIKGELGLGAPLQLPDGLQLGAGGQP